MKKFVAPLVVISLLAQSSLLASDLNNGVTEPTKTVAEPMKIPSAFDKLPKDLQKMPGVLAAKDKSAFMFRFSRKGNATVYFQGTDHGLPYNTLCATSQCLIEGAEILYCETGNLEPPVKEEDEIEVLKIMTDTKDHGRYKDALTVGQYEKFRDAFLTRSEHPKPGHSNSPKRHELQFETLGGAGLFMLSQALNTQQDQSMDVHIVNHLEKKVKSLDLDLVPYLDEKLSILSNMPEHYILGEIIASLAEPEPIVTENIFSTFYNNRELLSYIFQCITVCNVEYAKDANISKRNQLWFKKLNAEASSRPDGGSIVACGGAGHYDLLEIFERNGYTIEMMDIFGQFHPFPITKILQRFSSPTIATSVVIVHKI